MWGSEARVKPQCDVFAPPPRRTSSARPRLFQRTRPPNLASIPIPVSRSSLPLGQERASRTCACEAFPPRLAAHALPGKSGSRPVPGRRARGALPHPISLSYPSAPSRPLPRIQSDVQRCNLTLLATCKARDAFSLRVSKNHSPLSKPFIVYTEWSANRHHTSDRLCLGSATTIQVKQMRH
ncbi:hypothetical protein EV363DRAFT_500432 [Boletus edulis]|nr:hypothetical protein EV363DRAFT_500432 [Boletus edulis]